MRSIAESDDREKIFLTGSSQTREDFDVDYLNRTMKETHAVFYNFGTSGNASPIEMLMIKDRLLDPAEYAGIDLNAAVDTAASVLGSDLWDRARSS